MIMENKLHKVAKKQKLREAKVGDKLEVDPIKCEVLI